MDGTSIQNEVILGIDTHLDMHVGVVIIPDFPLDLSKREDGLKFHGQIKGLGLVPESFKPFTMLHSNGHIYYFLSPVICDVSCFGKAACSVAFLA